MIGQAVIPAPPLCDFVELLWYQEGAPPAHRQERLLPQGTVELVVDLWNDEPGCVVCGPHSAPFLLETYRRRRVVGAHFRPGGAFPFLGMPASELHNQVVSLDDVWGAGACLLRERLLEAETVSERFHLLEQMLLARAQGSLARHGAVRWALGEFCRPSPTRTVADVTSQIGLSARRLIQLFRQEVGLTPKLFCRVQRFQSVLELIHTWREVDWVDVALACGYFDQAHFIHDFRAFSGLSPTAYLAQQGDQRNHVPVLA
ncbi:MAG: AraC family transcriptional regulator [Chloroflexi bacterium]|nr:MAG: AraC family transcriptional regulator [Chloroflexota bacterium]